MTALVIGDVLIFTWFMPNFIADAPIRAKKAVARICFELDALRFLEDFPRV